jgi:hypothetical protein
MSIKTPVIKEYFSSMKRTVSEWLWNQSDLTDSIMNISWKSGLNITFVRYQWKLTSDK